MAVKNKKIYTPPNVDRVESLTMPDEVIDYVVSHFLQKRQTDGVVVSVGISAETVETVLQLFVDWAALNGYVNNNVMVIGGSKVD